MKFRRFWHQSQWIFLKRILLMFRFRFISVCMNTVSLFTAQACLRRWWAFQLVLLSIWVVFLAYQMSARGCDHRLFRGATVSEPPLEGPVRPFIKGTFYWKRDRLQVTSNMLHCTGARDHRWFYDRSYTTNVGQRDDWLVTGSTFI